MIIQFLNGGCANQLFQYAFGLAQSLRLNTDLKLDITSFRGDSMRQYTLGLFNVKNELVTGSRPTVNEKSLPYDQELVDSIKDGDCIKGYFQTEQYFSHLRSELLEIFKPRQPLTYWAVKMKELIQEAGDEAAFLTVRRTDYVIKQDFHGVLPMTYYEEALSILTRTVKQPKIFLFSDEPKWCDKNFNLSYPYIIAGTFDMTTPSHLGREDQDIYLMSLCRHALMANSSFSWWGSWLYQGSEDGRVVIAPKKWFTAEAVDSKDIVPDRWIRV